MPACARESIQLGVCAREASRSASAIPGTWRSITASVASGVTSLGATPVPPLVRISSHALLVAVAAQELFDPLAVVGDQLEGVHLDARAAAAKRSSGSRLRSAAAPAEREVLIEMSAARGASHQGSSRRQSWRPPVFSSSATSSITTPRSSPLTMS